LRKGTTLGSQTYELTKNDGARTSSSCSILMNGEVILVFFIEFVTKQTAQVAPAL